MKVIVIDDDPIVLEMVQGILEDMGHEVSTRTSAMGASAWILRERPDVVLVDLNMPALSGDQWLTLVTEKSIAQRRDYVPNFVVFSARDVDELEQVVRETCAIGYIQKSGSPLGFETAFRKIVQGIAS